MSPDRCLVSGTNSTAEFMEMGRYFGSLWVFHGLHRRRLGNENRREPSLGLRRFALPPSSYEALAKEDHS